MGERSRTGKKLSNNAISGKIQVMHALNLHRKCEGPWGALWRLPKPALSSSQEEGGDSWNIGGHGPHWAGAGQGPGAHGLSCSYRTDPVIVVGDPGEDGGLAVVVAAEGGPEADYAMHLPLAIICLAVQWPAGVPLVKVECACSLIISSGLLVREDETVGMASPTQWA